MTASYPGRFDTKIRHDCKREILVDQGHLDKNIGVVFIYQFQDRREFSSNPSFSGDNVYADRSLGWLCFTRNFELLKIPPDETERRLKM